MRELPVPSLRKLFALRQFPALAGVDLAELAVIAENVREIRHAMGAEVGASNTPPSAIHLVVEGAIETEGSCFGAREVFGLLEALSKRALRGSAIAARDTHTLHLTTSDLLEILEDSFGVLTAVNRSLVKRLLEVGPPEPQLALPSSARLTLVERFIVLRQLPPFARSRLQALAALAQGCEELTVPAGTALAVRGQLPEGFWIPLDGIVHAPRDDSPHAQILRIPGPVGLWESIGTLRHDHDVAAATPVRILRCPTAAFVDVLEDHTDLGLAIASNVAAALLDAPRPVEHGVQHHWS